MAHPSASAKRITPNLGLGIRRYDALGGETRSIWMLEAREHCGCGTLYAESAINVEHLRDLKAFAEDAIRIIQAAKES